MKSLIIDKMEKDLMPNLQENIIEDFYLTPNYFENDLNTKQCPNHRAPNWALTNKTQFKLRAQKLCRA